MAGKGIVTRCGNNPGLGRQTDGAMQHSMIQPGGRDPVPWAAAQFASAQYPGLVMFGDAGRMAGHGALSGPMMRRLLSPAALIDGVDRYLARRMAGAERAGFFILLLPPLGNLDNPFYRVHPRRNDRFLAPLAPLRALYPEIDFADFDFTGHMLGALAATCPARFAELRRGIAPVWLRGMTALLDGLPSRGVLLHAPDPPWLPLPVGALARPGLSVLDANPADPGGAAESLRRVLTAQTQGGAGA